MLVVGAVSVIDITRALQIKIVQSREEVERSLPGQLRHLTDSFLDDEASKDDALPSHKLGIDIRLSLQKDSQGRDKETPWNPLYGMSRGELLVLRKTLKELPDKN